MTKLGQYRVPLFAAIGAVIIVVVVYAMWISPETAKLSSLHNRESQLQVQEASLQTEINMLQHEQENLKPTCSTLAQDLTEIPLTPTVSDFLRQVTGLAVSSGDPNTPSISVTQATGNGSGSAELTAVSVNLTLQGTYGQLSTFLSGLYSFPRLYPISSISFAGNPVAIGPTAPPASEPNYSLGLVGTIYYSSLPQPACPA
jgi:Tfp pilus assembly protein PilO